MFRVTHNPPWHELIMWITVLLFATHIYAAAVVVVFVMWELLLLLLLWAHLLLFSSVFWLALSMFVHYNGTDGVFSQCADSSLVYEVSSRQRWNVFINSLWSEWSELMSTQSIQKRLLREKSFDRSNQEELDSDSQRNYMKW